MAPATLQQRRTLNHDSRQGVLLFFRKEELI